MNPTRIEHVRRRVVDLRNRLQDIKALLSSVASDSHGGGEAVHANVGIAIRAIEAVSDDLAAVCDEQLEDPIGISFQAAKAIEARSEVESGEFDTQG